MSHLTKFTCKGTLQQVFYLCECPLLPYYDPIPPPPLTHRIRVCPVYLLTQGGRAKGRGEELTREKVRVATVHKAGSKIPT